MSNLIKVIMILLALVVLLVAVVTVNAGQNQERICFCHNVNNNPHTICTSNKGRIKGHTKHVRNGEDYVGKCELDVTPSSTPEATENPSSEPSSTPVVACNSHCNSDQECRDRDSSYICTPQHVCRLEEAPERQECNPRPEGISTDELHELEGNPKVFGPQK